MKTIKVSEATGPALDWLVAKCEGLYGHIKSDGVVYTHENGTWYHDWSPSTSWSQGGQIIEREDIEIVLAAGHHESAKWMGVKDNNVFGFGPTQLIAAMRCRVISKLGDTADVPEELL